MKTGVIYARYSSDSQTEQSIEGQMRVCEEYAKKNNIVILGTYIDRAMTGTNDNRPDFQRMIKDSARREWNYILVYKLDRFSRNKYETAIHKKALKDNGVRVLSATEFVPDTPEGIIFESMLEGYAEYYSAELSQKIRRGNHESRRKGNLTGGGIAYGYKNVDKKAVIVPEEAEVVRYIYQQYSEGVCIKDIIEDLSAQGIYKSGKPFTINAIYKILRNEKYVGICRYDGEVFDNIYPQIVSDVLYQKVRKKIELNRFGKNCVRTEYLLKFKVRCGYCGSPVVAESGTSHTGTKKYYYKCRGRKVDHNNCEQQAVRKEMLENIVIDRIVKDLCEPQIMDNIVCNLLRIQEEELSKNITLNMLVKEKQVTDTAIGNIMTAIECGGSTSTAMNRIRELEHIQEELEIKIAKEKSKTQLKVSEEFIREYYEAALRMKPKLLIEYLIKEVVIYNDKIEIHYNNPLTTSPEDDRGFFVAVKTETAYRMWPGKKITELKYDVESYVN